MKRAVGFLGMLLGGALLAGCAGVDRESRDAAEEVHYTSLLLLEDEASRAVLPEGVEPRYVYKKGLDMTARFEGYRKQLYHDAAGHCTIGFGHLLKLGACDDTLKETYKKGLEKPSALKLLGEDMHKAEVHVQVASRAAMTDGQFAAICDFAFNCGTGNLKKAGIMKLMNAGQIDQVAVQMGRFVKAGGRVLPGLVQRREAEIALLYEGLPATRAVLPEGEAPEPIDILAP